MRRSAAFRRTGYTGLVLVAMAAVFAPFGSHGAAAAPFCTMDPPIEFSAARTRGIVQRSNAIVRATALGYAAMGAHGDTLGTYVSFAVREVLKGDAVPDTLVFYGTLDDRDSFHPADEPVPYLESHRWYGGSCLSTTYRPGGEYLLLLGSSKRMGKSNPYWVWLAPTNEQIRGPDDGWVAWVRQAISEN